jgi:hypothetical protein
MQFLHLFNQTWYNAVLIYDINNNRMDDVTRTVSFMYSIFINNK